MNNLRTSAESITDQDPNPTTKSVTSAPVHGLQRGTGGRILMLLKLLLASGCAATSAYQSPTLVEKSNTCNSLDSCVDKMVETIISLLDDKEPGRTLIAAPYFRPSTLTSRTCNEDGTGPKVISIRILSQANDVLDKVWNKLHGESPEQFERNRGDEVDLAARSQAYTMGQPVRFDKGPTNFNKYVVVPQVYQSDFDRFTFNIILLSLDEAGAVVHEESTPFELTLNLNGTDDFLPNGVPYESALDE